VISEPSNVSLRQIENVQRDFVKSIRYGLDKALKKLGSLGGGKFANLFEKSFKFPKTIFVSVFIFYGRVEK